MNPGKSNASRARRRKAMRAAWMTATFMLAPGLAFSGDLYPPGSPAPTMKNLQEIYDQAAQVNRAAGGGDVLLFFPYVLERQGFVSDTQYTFDTLIYLLATGALTGQGLKDGAAAAGAKDAPEVAVHLYLYNNNGQPATSAMGTPIANPATFTVGPTNPMAAIRLETLIQDAGGFASPIFLGFVVLSIDSGDWNDVAVDAYIVHSHTGPGDLEVTPLPPKRVQDSQVTGVQDTADTAFRAQADSETGNR